MSAPEPSAGRPQREAELAMLAEKREWAAGLGGPEKVARQHARGRMTARERALALVDEGTFVEFGALAHADAPERAGRSPGLVMLMTSVSARAGRSSATACGTNSMTVNITKL